MQKYNQIIRFVIIGYCSGLLTSYIFGKKWVFRLSGNLKIINKIIFFLTYMTGGIIMTIITSILEDVGLNYMLAWLIGVSYAVVNNFLGSKYLVFKEN